MLMCYEEGLRDLDAQIRADSRGSHYSYDVLRGKRFKPDPGRVIHQ